MRKMLISAAFLAALSGAAQAQLYGTQNRGGSYGTPNYGYGTGSNPNSHYVNPYTTRNGNSVQGHWQTDPNSTQLDNYGTRGNLNPYTGQYGTRSPRY